MESYLNFEEAWMLFYVKSEMYHDKKIQMHDLQKEMNVVHSILPPAIFVEQRVFSACQQDHIFVIVI